MRDPIAPRATMPAATRTCIKPMARGVCGAPVPGDAPLPLCMPDLAAAWQYCGDKIARARIDQAPEEMRQREERHLTLMNRATAERQAAEAKAAEELDDADDPNSVVYYVRFADRIKIGFSRNLGMRLTAIPHDELLTVEPGARITEQKRHQQFAKHRIIGEWFAAAPELLRHVEQLRVRHAERERWKDTAKEAFTALDRFAMHRSAEEVLRSI